MPARSRPLLAVRLIGPTDIVTAHKAQWLQYLAAVYGDALVCRTSTRLADHVGEIRAYITVRRKEVPTP